MEPRLTIRWFNSFTFMTISRTHQTEVSNMYAI